MKDTCEQGDYHIPSKEEIDRVLEFLPIFEAEGFEAGKWDFSHGPTLEPSMGPEFFGFWDALHDSCWFCLGDYNYLEDKPILKYVRKPELIANADFDTLRKLLLGHTRTDRFVGGHLLCLFADGTIQAILRRVKELHEAGIYSN